MNLPESLKGLELGYDLPALPGMPVSAVQTPSLIVELDALERNIIRMRDFARAHGMRHRAHVKTHKSVDIARLQLTLGEACGICCQKVSEAEVFVRAGINDVLVSNQVQDPLKIDRLAKLPLWGARVLCCVDDLQNLSALAAATQRHGTTLECLVEIDCGSGRCGVRGVDQALAIARAIGAAPSLHFAGVQAYHGAMQHEQDYATREAGIAAASAQVASIVGALQEQGLPCEIVGGGGTGSYPFESRSGVYNELQCGSYLFMDADYGRIHNHAGQRIADAEWEHALFILSAVMSHPTADRAIVDAGLKALSLDSGLPLIHGCEGTRYTKCSDEHGVVHDPHSSLKINDRLWLIPGHCDPTCNLHDWYVGIRAGKVETLWPVSARGKVY